MDLGAPFAAMRFKDKVMVVTGAARGIGFATARLAALEGALVVIGDLDGQSVDAAVQGITAEGGRALGVVGDVCSQSQVIRNVEQVMQAFGRIDVLVNNAASFSHKSAAELSEQQWRRELDVCLTGAFLWSQAAAVASMIPRREGAIVNVGSGAALAGMPHAAGYIAAKHGVVGLTKALAVDWGQYGIRVNCVCPGFTWTDLARKGAETNPEMMRQRVARIPLGAGAQPDEQAHAILFLASAQAGAISGVALPVDGGTLALSSGYSAPRDGMT
ncbi:MAG TPA: SDR family NAD(P)-dependent oxidoreductase [Ramlibacter sp.]|nr:SDR family NAD(P)-dependent oxidoreductase [Ramlibacter sp.]